LGVDPINKKRIKNLDCDEKLFWRVVKAGFNQRRKTLRNAVSAVMPKDKMDDHIYFEKRAEQLTVDDFVKLTQHISSLM